MSTNTELGKIEKVLGKISGKKLKDFARLYACTHEDFATALIERYWKPERGNYKEMVEACFAHAGVLGKLYVWGAKRNVIKEIEYLNSLNGLEIRGLGA